MPAVHSEPAEHDKGAFVAVGDFNGDGKDDLILGQGYQRQTVEVISGLGLSSIDQTVLNTLKIGKSSYRGGVSVAAGDLNGDGKADLIIGRNHGRPSQIETFSGIDMHSPAAPILPFDSNPAKPKYALGVRVAAVDVNLDGIADIIAAVGGNGNSQVKIYDGATDAEITIRAITAFPAFPNSALFVAGSSPAPSVKSVVLT